MQLLITFLTVLLVLNCLLLILLVLIQLPKKEAGAGLAFGGGTTDALFGAGSGNALTKLTKYSAGTFLVMSAILGMMNVRLYHSGTSEVRRALAAQKAAATTPAPAPATAPTASPFTKLDPTAGTGLVTTLPAATTNAPAVAATNAVPVATNVARPAATTAATNTNAPK
jgi:preprotein translocase subunit SecG